MTKQPHCPKCGTPLPADAPAGLCPKCLLQAGLESEPRPHSMPAATMPSPAFSGFEPLSVENLAGKFPQLEILELLGKGGMGAVYKARQRGLDRLVAVKVLPPEIGHDPAFAERFTREARALARLSHNHIVSVFDFGQSDGLFYIVMEYVDGVNLRQTIQTGKLTPAEALAIVPQICEALQFAHDEGIVHRDIKPENILIDKRGRVKIADFGLAKLMAGGGSESPDASLTATHQVMGTLRYMAPEQMQGTREVDHRADIYSLGVIFYELLTGELPMGKFAPPSQRVQVDVRLDEIVLRALEQQPEQRYQHASEVKSDVENISRSRQPTSETLPEPAKRGREAVAGLPETQVRFVVSDKSDVPRQANFHFSTLGYQLIEQGPDLCVFQRGSKWAGLWAFDIRRLHTILTVRTAPAADGGMWVSCNWSIRKLGSWIPKSDIALLEEEGLGLAAVLNEKTETGPGSWPPAGRVTPVIASEPRISRFAIAGAVWALFGLLAVAPALLFDAWRPTPVPVATNGVTQLQIPWPVMLMGVMSILGATAPLGTTILGALAIGHIKRSGGKIIGLPLAVADAIFFPLLALGGAVALLVAEAFALLGPYSNAAAVVSAVSFGALVAVLVCFFVARAAWRTIAGHVPAGSRQRSWRQPLPWVLAAIILVLAGGVGWIQRSSSPPWAKLPSVPPLKTITSGYGVQFLVPAGNVAVFEIVTRQGNATVPVPTHCGYVMASQETPLDGTFLWSRMEEDIKAPDGHPIRRWQIEIRTAGGGGGHSEGFLLPEGLDSAVGASSIALGDLEPNEERVYWGVAVDASNLPANGLIGLRVSVLPHGQNRSGSGISHIDWKSPPKSSTTRRKLDP